MKTPKLLYEEESYKIIGCCLEVHSILGNGFLEAVYQEALSYEFNEKNIPYVKEKKLDITYKNLILKNKYFADFICYNKIIIEIKALSSLTTEHYSQIINYLKATGYQLGLLINFGEKSLKYKRFVL